MGTALHDHTRRDGPARARPGRPVTEGQAPTRQEDRSPLQDEVLGAVREDLPEEAPVTPDDVAQLAGRLRERTEGLQPARGSRALRLDGYVLGAALLCPARTLQPPFAWSAPKAGRRLGLLALRTLVHEARQSYRGLPRHSPVEAVREVIDAEQAGGSPSSVGSWLATLSDPETAAVVASAATWASQAWLAVPWAALVPILKADSFKFMPFGAEGPIRLEGRVDATITVPGTDGQHHVALNVARREAPATRLDALVRTLQVRRAPLRVVTVDPTQGTVQRLEVDRSALDLAVEESASALSSLARQPLAEVPGRHCFRCDRHHECGPGTAWRTAHRSPLP